MKISSDNEIIKLILESNNPDKGFELLVKKYKKPIYWHLRRFIYDHDETNDLVQEVFIKIWKNLSNFKKESKLFTWIYRITTNEALAYIQKMKRRNLFSSGNYEKKLENSLTDDNYFNGDEIQKRLYKALLNLPEKQRMVFNLKYFDELKYEEMSEILGTSVGALKASYHIAVKKIENELTEN